MERVKGADVVRVVTWNIWASQQARDERLALLADALTSVNPDVVALQEAWVGAATELARHCNLDVIVQATPDRSAELMNVLLAAPSMRGSDDTEQILLDGWDDQGQRRGAVTARLVAPSGRRWSFTSTHLAWGGRSEGVRLQQAQQLDVIAQATQQRIPALVQVLAGDFNCEPDSATWRYLMGRDPLADSSSTLWVDAWKTAGNGDGTTVSPTNANARATGRSVGILDPSRLPARRIDGVFVHGFVHGRPGSPLSARLLGDGDESPSDHYGVMVDLWDPQLP